MRLPCLPTILLSGLQLQLFRALLPERTIAIHRDPFRIGVVAPVYEQFVIFPEGVADLVAGAIGSDQCPSVKIKRAFFLP